MNINNYQKMLVTLNEIKNFPQKPKLLLHACCAPCASAVLKRICDFFDITIYFYNPNISPLSEYNKRKNEFKKLKSICEFKLICASYNHNSYLTHIKGYEKDKEGSYRCELCYRQRLEKVFVFAVKNGYDFVATTLTLSPYKNEKIINSIGENLSKICNINYLVSDFKKEDGYKKSIELCTQLGIYRQNYCGCEFSLRI